ncbi:helix-turn-helix domain-containing protein [Bacillus daqingensis]|uniref:Helix-turn-helix domain-containing protein n=1 Tax=Bacillus daqingensis TaxID=872396 RepID=A0ABV9NXB1_9BACI
MKTILLHVLSELQESRSASGAVHIIKGKRSAQTIQDIQLFHLSKWAGAARFWKGTDPSALAEELFNQQLITGAGRRAALTNKGFEQLKQAEWLQQLYFQGREYEWNGFAEAFWRKLNLTVQAAGSLASKNKGFLPVYAEAEERDAVRKIIKSAGSRHVNRLLYNKLEGELSLLSERSADIFVSRLAGNASQGKTVKQLAGRLSEEEVFLRWRSVLHWLMKSEWPAELQPLISHIEKQKSRLTNSAEKTKRFVYEGKTKAEIAALRGLKSSTVEDHLVELAMFDPDFPAHNYISEKRLKDLSIILQSSDQQETLKELKEKAGDKGSYFDIRLAGALLKNRKGAES